MSLRQATWVNIILLSSLTIQLSENVKKLSDEYKEKRGYIPWNAMYGLRNRIVHDYGNVDLNIVFECNNDHSLHYPYIFIPSFNISCVNSKLSFN